MSRGKILAIASGGGHWVELIRIAPALDGHDVAYVTVDEAYRHDIDSDARFHVVNDATRWNKTALFILFLRLASILWRERPDVVISTGAAPGYFGLRLGKLLGARTVWIDSIANVEELSLSGQRIGRYADLWLTQWPHLASQGGPRCLGAILDHGRSSRTLNEQSHTEDGHHHGSNALSRPGPARPLDCNGAIFVTVGAQMPFDRLIRAVDDWAEATGRRNIYAQIGRTSYRPRAVEWSNFLDPEEFKSRARSASIIIAHAGTGSILTAMQFQKPILVMPRRCELRETRNNHQIATALRFQSLGSVSVAMDEHELRRRLVELRNIAVPNPIGPHASKELIAGIRAFLANEQAQPDQSEPRQASQEQVAQRV